MFIFGRWGILTLLFGSLGIAAFAVVGLFAPAPLAMVVGGAVAASLCWWVGKRLNKPKLVIDKETRKEIDIGRRANHLFFVPMQYYAFVYAVLFGLGAIVGFNLSDDDHPTERAEPKIGTLKPAEQESDTVPPIFAAAHEANAPEGRITVNIKLDPRDFRRDNKNSTVETPHSCAVIATVTNGTQDHLNEAVLWIGGSETNKIESVAANTRRENVFLLSLSPTNDSCVATVKFVTDNITDANVTTCLISGLSEGACQKTFVITTSLKANQTAALQQRETHAAQDAFNHEREVQLRGTGIINRKVGDTFDVNRNHGLKGWSSMDESIEDSKKRYEYETYLNPGDQIVINQISQDMYAIDKWYGVEVVGKESGSWIMAFDFQDAIREGWLTVGENESSSSQQESSQTADVSAPPSTSDASGGSSSPHPIKEGVFCGRTVHRPPANADGNERFVLVDNRYSPEIPRDVSFGILDHDIVIRGQNLPTTRVPVKFWQEAFDSSDNCLCISGAVESPELSYYVFHKINGYAFRDQSACQGISEQ